MAVSKPDPKRFALWAIAGATLVAISFFITLLPFPHTHTALGFWARQCENRLALVSFLTPIVIGGSLWYQANKRLERGYADGLWSEAELVSVRALLAQEYWNWMSFVLFAFASLGVAFSNHGGGLIYLMIMPMNAVTSLRRLLIPPIVHPHRLIDWQNFKPLHSDHWGEGPRSHNDALPS